MTVARWISLLVAVAFCMRAGTIQHVGELDHRPAMVVAAMLYMVGPLAMIWFSDILRSPDNVLAKLMGWILLAITPLAVSVLHFRLDRMEWLAQKVNAPK